MQKLYQYISVMVHIRIYHPAIGKKCAIIYFGQLARGVKANIFDQQI